MSGDAEHRQLAEIYDFSSGLSKPRSAFGSGFPFVGFKDVFYNTFLPAELTELVETTEKERARCSVKRGDVFLTRTSETQDELGMSCVALTDYPEATFNGFTKRLRPKPDSPVLPEFAAYYFRGPLFRAQVNALSSMSTRASLNNDMLALLEIRVPSMAEQQMVAAILKSLDDRIALNHGMNQTLEDIARAIFKSWFIDHDPVHAKARGEPTGLPPEIDALFPDAFEDDSFQVPTGWPTTPLGELVRVERGLSYKGKHVVDEGRPLLNLGCFGLDATLRQDKLKHYDGDFKDRHVVQPGDLLVANTDMTQERTILGTPLMVPDSVGEALFTHHVYAVRPRSKTSPATIRWLRLALLQPAFRFEAEGRATGTTVLFMPADAIQDFAMPLPSANLIDAFDQIVKPLLDRQALNLQQAGSLSSLRDLLLPKLISGEVRIPHEVVA